MGEPRFTQGPWHTEIRPGGIEIWGPKDGEWVADCGYGRNSADCALLIVSAPDLYYALESSIRALNIGLSRGYVHHADSIYCNVCGRTWPIHFAASGTAGANVEHDPEATCGIMHQSLKDAAIALKKAGR